MKYQIVYADPPWTFGSKHYQDGNRDFKNLKEHYNIMTTEQIMNMSFPIADDAVCFMWTTDAHLEDALRVLKAWGFTYKTIAFVWVKKYASGSFCYNFAPWTLKSCEICIMGIKGQMGKYKKANNIKQLVIEERTEHSKKPNEVRNRIIELFGDLARIELFARERFEGWDAIGDELEEIPTKVEVNHDN